MSTDYIFLKEVPLKTHCPECYNTNGLNLAFYQKKQSTKMYSKVTGIIEERLRCKVCETSIYPARWSDDIERMYDYHIKTVSPVKKTLRLTPVSTGLIIGILLLIAAIAGYMYYTYSLTT